MSSHMTQDMVDDLFEQWNREDDERIIRQLKRRLTWIQLEAAPFLPERIKGGGFPLGPTAIDLLR